MKRLLVLIFGVFVPLVMIVVVFLGYTWVFESNVTVSENTEVFVYPEDDPKLVLKKLVDANIIKNERSFILVAQQKKWYTSKTGRYIIEPGMNNNDLVNMFRAGLQAPATVTINHVSSIADVAGQLGAALLVDSTQLFKSLVADSFLQAQGLNYASVRQLVIPNTYEFYWNTSAENVRKRLVAEYEAFWDESRIKKAKAQGLDPLGVATLASIVQKETAKADEMRIVAGLYLNRLKRGMKLQSDPTVIFAKQLKDGGEPIKRVLFKDLEIDSPYNTYKHAGLPPGPITIATIQSIEAVLNPANHNYIYMCANPDKPGYHSFAANSRQHSINRQKYINWLNQQGIRR